MTEDTPPQHFERHISRTLRATRAAMTIESAVRSFWPALCCVAAIWAAIAFGLGQDANRMEVMFGFGAACGLLAYLAGRGIRRFRWPSRSAAVARLDASLAGRPLAALEDRPALGAADPAVRTLWAVHRARMMERARAARPIPADLRLSREDPWAIRLAVLVFFIAALVFARTDAVATLTSALGPSAGPAPEAGPSYEGWAEPPLYTGRPTLYLPDIAGEEEISLPKGTLITLRAYGDQEQFLLEETVTQDGQSTFSEAAPGISIAEFKLARSGAIELERNGRAIGNWAFAIEPDAPPMIELVKDVERAPGGAMRLGFLAKDDHGVTAARATIELDLAAADRRYGLAADPEPRDPLELPLPLPVSGSMLEVAGTLVEDLSKHPWADLPVRIKLVAEDALAQTGEQSGIKAILPGRRFYDPAAAALAEQRRDLLWSVQNASRVAQVLRAVSWRPEGLFDRAGAYLITRTAIRRLESAISTGTIAQQRDEIAEALWRAAVLLEDGSLGDAADRLAKAKERLQEALRGDATDEEIAELMEELREATRDYMEQMAREALENGETETAEAPPEGQTINQDQLQELMDRIQELSEQGRRAEAEALLDMLQRMLENMEMRFTQGGEGQSGQGEQSMQGLADALREQQGLADDSFEQLQDEFREGSGQPGREGQSGQSSEGEQSGGGQQNSGLLAERQEALRELLDELQQNLPGTAGKSTRETLENAERSMESARDSLSEGDTAEALDQQAEAIDGLRQGMQSLSRDMRQAEGGQGNQDSPNGTAQSRNPTDPLGRPIGSTGGTRTDSQMLPEGADAAARARQILEEIRRRSGDLSRPEIELEYLRRLLDRF
jgi:uncharacterized protein (TIGR02302 family)